MVLVKISIENIPNDASLLIAYDNNNKNNIITNDKCQSEWFNYWVNPNEPILVRVRKNGWKPIEIRSHYNNYNYEHLNVTMEIDI